MGSSHGKCSRKKESEDGGQGGSRLVHGLSSCQGWRPTMEDAHLAITNFHSTGHGLYGVFDGHGGKTVALFSQKSIQNELKRSEQFERGEFGPALIKAFMDTDARLINEGSEWTGAADGAEPSSPLAYGGSEEKPEDYTSANLCGTTAVVALVTQDKLVVANAGDSRAVLSANGRAVALSEDHKPGNPGEVERIQAAGGTTWSGRVNGRLAVSRALGDLQFKQNTEVSAEAQMVSALPDITERVLLPEDDFLVLACDGIWDVKSNQEVVDFVASRLGNGQPISKIGEELIDACIAPDMHANAKGLGCDNMTVVIVALSSRACALANRTEADAAGVDGEAAPARLKALTPPTIYDAVVGDTVEGVSAALALGDPVDGFVGENETPLHVACASGKTTAVGALIDAKANIEAADWDTCTPIIRAAAAGQSDIVTTLISRGADITAFGQHGRDYKWSALHFAAESGSLPTVQALIGAKAEIDAGDGNNRSSLVIAAGHGHTDIVKLLVSNGALLEPSESSSVSALYKAVQAGHVTVVETLLSLNAKVDIRNSSDQTPLHAAAEKGGVQVAQMLIKARADLSARDEDEMTPLHTASQVGQPDIVSCLLASGADRTALTYDRKTPLNLADCLMDEDVKKRVLEAFEQGSPDAAGGDANGEGECEAMEDTPSESVSAASAAGGTTPASPGRA